MEALTLPWPPSVNHYYRRVGARTLISREGRRYRSRICAILKDRITTVFEGRVRMDIDAHPPDRRRRDLDNITKALLDALEHAGVYEDDSQIDRLQIERCSVVPRGQVIVRISEAED